MDERTQLALEALSEDQRRMLLFFGAWFLIWFLARGGDVWTQQQQQ